MSGGFCTGAEVRLRVSVEPRILEGEVVGVFTIYSSSGTILDSGTCLVSSCFRLTASNRFSFGLPTRMFTGSRCRLLDSYPAKLELVHKIARHLQAIELYI